MSHVCFNLTVLILTVSAALAAEIAPIPPTVIVQNQLEQKKLAQDTIVRLPSFNIVVPRSWSFHGQVQDKPTGSDGMTQDFIGTPSEDIPHSKIYVGVREINAAMPIEQILARAKARKGHTISQPLWGNVIWILEEYSEQAADKTPLTLWVARTDHGVKSYEVLVSVPTHQRKIYDKTLAQTMATIRFNNP